MINNAYKKRKGDAIMTQKNTDIIIPEEAPSIPESAMSADVLELLPAEEPVSDTTSPIIPIVAALVSAGVTALGFWIYGKIKAKKAAKNGVVVFDPDGTTDEPDEDATATEDDTDSE
jgi:hypothetical protein